MSVVLHWSLEDRRDSEDNNARELDDNKDDNNAMLTSLKWSWNALFISGCTWISSRLETWQFYMGKINQESVVGSVIQAAGTLKFDNGFGTVA